MSEKNENLHVAKPKISILAVISLLLSMSAFIQAIISFTFLPTMGAIVFCMLLIALSVIWSICALIVISLINLSVKKVRGTKIVLLSIGAPIVLFFLLGPAINLYKHLSWENESCSSNLGGISRAIYMYQKENGGKYPQPDKWCDLLAKYDDPNYSFFICHEAQKRGDKGPCHFAINPNCGPNSPPDTILIFESKGGWNQYGGMEKMCFKHHRISCANYLLNEGPFDLGCTTGFVRPKNTQNLNWNGK
jgi:hypothetical protein